MAVNPLDVYRVVADQTMDPAEKRAQINMLYGVAAPPAIAQSPDVRTADAGMSVGGDPNSVMFGSGALPDPSQAPPAPSPAVSDVGAGGMSGMSGGAEGAPSVSVPPAATQSTISPEALAAAAAEKASTPAAPARVGAEPAGPSDQENFDTGIRQLVGGAMRGTPARRIAAHDQPTASVVEHAAAIPDDLKKRMADDAAAEAKLATDEGEQAGKAHFDAAIAADNEAHGARADQSELIAREKAQHEHLAKLDSNFEQLVKDTEYKPGDWWASKNTGQKVMTLLSAVMFGLAGDPQGLQKVIDDDMALRDANRKTRLGAAKSSIDSFRAQMMSPEAAHAAERALAAQAVAADARRLAEAAAAPEARIRGLQVAQHFQDQFDQYAAEMARQETGTIRTNIAHLPERVVGGGPDPLTIIKRAKEAGLDPEKVLRALTGGTYGGPKNDSEAKTRVIFPDHTVGYTSEDLHKETQTQLDSLGKLHSNLARIRALTEKTGHTLAGPDLARLKALHADTVMELQAMARGEGAQARMAGEMLDKLGPLAGSQALETGTSDASARASIDEALRLYDSHVQTIKDRLTPTPDTAPSGGKIQTLGKSKADLGAEPSE